MKKFPILSKLKALNDSLTPKVESVSGTTNSDGNYRTAIPSTAKIITHNLPITCVFFVAYNVYWIKAYTNDSSGFIKIAPSISFSGNIYYWD